MLSCIYFAFTSLTTVGFGDFYPTSDGERMVCGLILFGGIIVFSTVQGTLTEILGDIELLSQDLDEGDQLSKFIGLIAHFNEDEPMPLAKKQKIEQFFDFKWKNDLKIAIDDESEKAILDQLPDFVSNRLLTEFLFKDFLETFSETFKIPNCLETKRFNDEIE